MNPSTRPALSKSIAPIMPAAFSVFAAAFAVVQPAGAVAIFNDDWQTDLTVLTFYDARTDDNAVEDNGDYLWTIDIGADVYTQEQYERPTDAMDSEEGGYPAADLYYEYIDIVSGQFALDTDQKVAYFSIDLVGQDEINQSGDSTFKGFGQFYRIRLDDDADFFYGYMFGVKDPYGNGVDGTWDGGDNYKSTQGWIDDGTDPVTQTGLTITGEGTDGYSQLTSEGSSSFIRARIVGDSVQIAVAYGDLGISEDIFRYFIFEANKGLTDVGNYFWNDKYNLAEAGSPYDLGNPPDGNIYELDTLRGLYTVLVPEPGSLALLSLGLLGLGLTRRKAA